jgi:hypothetical protein
MTILIIGDSFADRMGRNSPWCDVLGEKLGEEIENYAVGGSSLSYSYLEFLKHYRPGKYSRVIFCRTDPNRQTYIMEDGSPNFLPFHINGKTSEDALPFMYKHNKNFMDPNDLNKEHRKIFNGQELINALFPNTYNWALKAISDSMHYNIKEPFLLMDINDLAKVQMLDYDNLGIKYDPSSEGKNRPNHLSVKQSNELAGYIYKYFTRGFLIDAIFENPEKYFTLAQTSEEAGLNK